MSSLSAPVFTIHGRMRTFRQMRLLGDQHMSRSETRSPPGPLNFFRQDRWYKMHAWYGCLLAQGRHNGQHSREIQTVGRGMDDQVCETNVICCRAVSGLSLCGFGARSDGTVRPVLPADAGASGQRTRCNLRRSIEECGPASFCQLGAWYGLPL